MKTHKTATALISLVIILSGCTNSTVYSETSDTEEQVSTSEIEETEETEGTEEEEENKYWLIKSYVDEFNNPTYVKYISNSYLINGVFSNSAVDNAELKVQLLIDRDSFGIRLYEYGKNLVKNTNSYSKKSDEYKVLMLNTYNLKYNFDGKIYYGSDRITITGEDMTTIIDAMKKDGKISFYIEESDRPICNYSFSFETNNFSQVYDEYK